MADEKELYFAHTMDLFWIITLWHWIHGGDPAQVAEEAQTTELIARGLIGHLGRGRIETANVIEKLAELGIKTMVTIDGKKQEIKTTKEIHDHYLAGHGPTTWPIPCAAMPDGRLICSWPPFWLYNPVEINRGWPRP
ncbi:MAG: hypothetical protein ABR971_15850 [Acidobacteriaceae bacterium]|jgi:hypothetical protein